MTRGRSKSVYGQGKKKTISGKRRRQRRQTVVDTKEEEGKQGQIGKRLAWVRREAKTLKVFAHTSDTLAFTSLSLSNFSFCFFLWS